MNNSNLHRKEDELDGFSVPENYFSSSRDQLLNRLKNSGFTVPENYFEKSAEQILKRVRKRHDHVPVFSINRIWYAAAAMILVTSAVLMLTKSGMHVKAEFSQVSNEEIMNYFLVSENMSDIMVNDLYTSELPMSSNEDEYLIHQIDEELLMNEL